MVFLYYPFLLIKFWYVDSCFSLLKYFLRLNKYLFYFFSTPLLISTFFKPLKNEYREGLVGFSIVFGIIIKTFVITFILILLLFFIAAEAVFFAVFLGLPVLAFWGIIKIG